MNFKNLIIFILLYFPCKSFSQNKLEVTNITKLNFLNPGVSFEKSINKKQTIYLNAFLNTFFTFTFSGALGNSAKILLEPSFSIQYRFYYNAKSRHNEGKNTALNNLNYVSPVYEIALSKRNFLSNYISESKARAVNNVGVVWGIQRNYAKRFSLDFNIGLGYLFTKGMKIDNLGNFIKTDISNPTFLGHLNLGFWLNKK